MWFGENDESIPGLALVVSQYTSQATDGIQIESIGNLYRSFLEGLSLLSALMGLKDCMSNNCTMNHQHALSPAYLAKHKIESSSALSNRQHPDTLLHGSMLKLVSGLLGREKVK